MSEPEWNKLQEQATDRVSCLQPEQVAQRRQRRQVSEVVAGHVQKTDVDVPADGTDVGQAPEDGKGQIYRASIVRTEDPWT